MSDFRDLRSEQRFIQDFADPEGHARAVFADYAAQGDVRAILHVEAAPELRGTGAAGEFMQALVDHARAENLKLTPVCSYAVAWLKRHPQAADVLA